MKTPLISNPKLLDAAIQQIQVLLGNLSFLEKSFGLCEYRTREGKRIPTVYQGENLDEYEVGLKDDIKAFCFWDKSDPVETIYPDGMGSIKQKYSLLKYNVSLIFYTFDLLKLGLASDFRQSQTIIQQEFLAILQRGLRTAQSDLVITNIYDRDITEVYRTFDVDPIKQPQYAIRFDCELSFRESCYDSNKYVTFSGVNVTHNGILVTN